MKGYSGLRYKVEAFKWHIENTLKVIVKEFDLFCP
jgi:hypothetical protein